MNVEKIQNQTSFNGKIKQIGQISKTQKHLLDLHRHNLENMIGDKPFDLFVRQSKSRKTITISADKKFESGYTVRKNEQNFENAASLAILDKEAKLAKEKEITQEMMMEYIQRKYLHNILGI